MYREKKILAVIPARGGSKRLPNKNILSLKGKPLISWTIDEASKSKYIDKVIVSTDSKEIAELSRKLKAEVPFVRPEYLSSDSADSISVIKHAIEFYKNEYDYAVLLQPTSPLRKVADIDKAIELLSEEVQSVVSVTECEHSPLWTNTLPKDSSLKSFINPEIKNTRSQDLPTFFRLNGAIYVAEVDYMIRNNGFFGDNSKAYVMPQDLSVDIDTQIDFLLAELLIEKQKEQ